VFSWGGALLAEGCRRQLEISFKGVRRGVDVSNGKDLRQGAESKGMRVAIGGDANVLITGPTGSGKSCLARRLHDEGRRSRKPFVAVNLATLHEGTFESELFGHERGAFTGAERARVGRLESAQGGTVFLDEVGELSPRLQARLLEFLQSRIIVPVGGNREIRLDVRVIAATHRDLNVEVGRRAFREDLFHRLRVVALALPSLSQRWRELDFLVHSCLESVIKSHGQSQEHSRGLTTGRRVLRISREVAGLLERHDWPGNFRELRNVLEYAVFACETDEIRPEDLPEWFESKSFEHSSEAAEAASAFELSEIFARLDHPAAMARFERGYLHKKLEENGGKINRTARKIGMNKTTLLRRIRRHGLQVAENDPTAPPTAAAQCLLDALLRENEIRQKKMLQQ
jgi:DNA-binding NtrC family response regulator